MRNTADLCPVCLAHAPDTPDGREHLATHTREELETATKSLMADLANEIELSKYVIRRAEDRYWSRRDH